MGRVFIQIRFLDSFHFLQSSIAKLAKSVGEKLHTQGLILNEQNKFEIICRIGVFTYEYITANDKLNGTDLPFVFEAFYTAD